MGRGSAMLRLFAGELMELKIYTVDEAAKVLKVSNMTLYRYIKAGKLRAAKFGKEWRITEENLKNFIDSMTPGERKDSNL